MPPPDASRFDSLSSLQEAVGAAFVDVDASPAVPLASSSGDVSVSEGEDLGKDSDKVLRLSKNTSYRNMASLEF